MEHTETTPRATDVTNVDTVQQLNDRIDTLERAILKLAEAIGNDRKERAHERRGN